MNDMLEKIARAIAESYYASDYDAEEAKAWAAKDWDDWLPEARAALLAMRGPGLEALSAMFDLMDGSELGEDYGIIDVWHAGIDAILAQPSTPADVTPA